MSSGKALQHLVGPAPYFDGWCGICGELYACIDEWVEHRATHPPGERPIARGGYDERRAEREAWHQATRPDRRRR
jgi:hypothetical protein